MKWPIQLVLIRHGESEYNALKKVKAEDEGYKVFLKAFDKDPSGKETVTLAQIIQRRFTLKVGDHNTPLTEKGEGQASAVGRSLRGKMDLPDFIFVPPYLRTEATLKKLVEGWPELADIRVVADERIREQEHGLVLLYNDWRVFQALNPDQRKLCDLEGPYWYRYPQGESVPDVRDRNRSWLGALVRDYAGKRILVVTHHLNILATRANLEGLEARDFIALDESEKPINCGVTVYRGDPNQGKDGKLVLESYNTKLC